MNPLRQGIQEYLELRRGMGFKLVRYEGRLHQFLCFLEEKRSSRITTRLALEFATQDRSLSPTTVAQRLSLVRGLARYRCGTDPGTEIPPLGLVRPRSGPARPYLYSEEEILRLLAGAMAYRPGPQLAGPWRDRFQGWTFYCILGLLAVTGLRVGEVLRLEPADVDWAQRLLTIRQTKFGKSRVVPVHRSALQAVARFLRHRDRFFEHFPPPQRPVRLFVRRDGTALQGNDVRRVFLAIRQRIGLCPPPTGRGPRLHDLRHRFAIQTLQRWYRSGQNAQRLLPVLSTYLGHAGPSSTYWYLHGTPELMAAAAQRLERRWKGVR